MRNLKTIFVFAILNLASLYHPAESQPYINLFSGRYSKSPDAGIFRRDKQAVTLAYTGLSANIPIQIKKNKLLLLLSPAWEAWHSDYPAIPDSSDSYQSLLFQLTLVNTLYNGEWSIALSVIPRINGEGLGDRGNKQIGGALLASYKANNELTLKFGVYANSEFFGPFIMPLGGIDWKINSRLNLFGVLPGNLVLEQKLGSRIYGGCNFRAITNSYARGGSRYWRVDENQLGIFLDFYPLQKVVLNLEAGHSLFRRIRTERWKERYSASLPVNDNWYIKLMAAFRIRLR